MCGNTRAPSIVGRLAVINATPRIGSQFGPLKNGVTVRIDEEVMLTDIQRAAYTEGNPEEDVPDYFYRTTLVSNPDGDSLDGIPKYLVSNVVLFRDEFDLAD